MTVSIWHLWSEHLAQCLLIWLGELTWLNIFINLFGIPRRRTKTNLYNQGKLDWDENCPAGRLVRDQTKALNDFKMSKTPETKHLFHLIRSMLNYDPSRRMTLCKFHHKLVLAANLSFPAHLSDKALRHPFFLKLPSVQRLHEK